MLIFFSSILAMKMWMYFYIWSSLLIRAETLDSSCLQTEAMP